MSEKRRGLGRGIGALIPPAPASTGDGAAGRDRPVDVFFPNGPGGRQAVRPAGTSTGQAGGTADPADPSVSRGTAEVADAGQSGSARGDAQAGEDQDLAVDGVPRETVAPHGEPAHDPPSVTALASSEPASAAPGDTQATGQDDAGPPAGDDDRLIPVPGARFAELVVSAIRPNSRQPRQVFDQDAMDELVHSVREIGVLQPVVVRPLPEPDADGARYELIMGERRWRASVEAGLQVVPAIVRATDDDVMLRDALLENLHRSELNPLEEAAAYQQLLEDFGCTQEELSRRIGRSRPQISNTIRLLRLPPAVQRRVAAGVLSAGHARALLALDDSPAAEKLAHRIVGEGLSVRAVEEIVSSRQRTTSRSAAPRAGRHLPLLDDVASRLSDRLDTRVKVALGRNRGRVTVEFASVEDLDRILSVLDPGGPGVTRRPETGPGPDEQAASDDPVVAVGAPEERYDT